MTGLSHVQLLVSDVGVSAAWYTEALGLEPYAEDLDTGYVALRHRGARIVIVLTAASDPGDIGRPSGHPDNVVGAPGELDHLAFAVPNEDALRSWADHLSGIGFGHPGVVDELGKPSLQFRDPDGIAIELVAPRRSGGWG